MTDAHDMTGEGADAGGPEVGPEAGGPPPRPTPFDLEASGTADGSDRDAGPEPPARPEPDPIELEAEPADRSRAAPRSIDEHCPNCGAEKPDHAAMLCLRCGFDMKTLKVVSTATGQVSEDEDEDGADEPEGRRPSRPPLSRPGRGGLKVPGVIAAVCGGLLVLGYLLGARGLFPDPAAGAEVAIGFGRRLEGLGRGAVLVGLWWTCGLGGLLFLAAVNGTRMGHWALAAMRLLAIATAMRVVTLLDAVQTVEWVLETAAQAAIFVLEAVLLFSLDAREALICVFFTFVSFGGLWLLSELVAWAM